MTKLGAAIDRWMHEEYRTDAALLAGVRVLYSLFVLIYLLPRWRWIGDLPYELLGPPPGLGWLIGAVPPPAFFVALEAVVAFAAVCLLLGCRTRTVSVVIACAFLVGNTYYYAAGTVVHDQMIVIVPLTLAAAGWGEAMSFGRRPAGTPRPGEGWPLALLATILALGMAWSGVIKAGTGWLDPSFQAVRGHLAQMRFTFDNKGVLSAEILRIDSTLFWECADWGVVLFEIGFIVALLRRRWLRVFCAAAVFFHLFVWLSCGIFFGTSLIAYSAFRCPPRAARGGDASTRASAGPAAAAPSRPIDLILVAALAGIVASQYAWLGNPLQWALAFTGLNVSWWTELLVCVTAIGFVIVSCRRRAARAVTG